MKMFMVLQVLWNPPRLSRQRLSAWFSVLVLILPVLVSPHSSIEGELLLLLTRREGRAAVAPLEQKGVAGVPLRLLVWSLMMT